MKSKTFPDSLFKQLDFAINQSPEPIAVFDADGTLWDMDLGEKFFQYQIESGKLDLPNNPMQHYLQMKKINNDPRAAYLWLAQINAGHTLQQVRSWAEDCAQLIKPFPLFDEQKHLIDHLHQQNVEIFIVTASIKWAVEPGAKRLGIKESNVLGVKSQVKDGIISTEQNGIITYKEGKAHALLEATSGVKPILCSGNTTGDTELLKIATEIALAVKSAPAGTELYETEIALQEIAKLKDWYRYSFK